MSLLAARRAENEWSLMQLFAQRSPILAVALLACVLGGCHRKHHDNAAATGNATEARTGAKGGPAPQLSQRQPLALSTDGLLLIDPDTGEAQQLLFETDQFQATQQVSKAIGNFTGQAENPDCAAGQLTSFDYPGGITLFFQDRKFVGWDFDGQGKYQTPNGVGIGTTLANLRGTGDVSVHDSAIGHEFAVGDLHGLVDATTPAGKVTNLWAGTTCTAR
jgi:hypothetical protein